MRWCLVYPRATLLYCVERHSVQGNNIGQLIQLGTGCYCHNLTCLPSNNVLFITEALIWYCPVTTTRTAHTSIPMSRVLPHNHQNTSTTQDIVDFVLIRICNVCSIIINEFSMIITVGILFLSCGIPARCTIVIMNV